MMNYPQQKEELKDLTHQEHSNNMPQRTLMEILERYVMILSIANFLNATRVMWPMYKYRAHPWDSFKECQHSHYISCYAFDTDKLIVIFTMLETYMEVKIDLSEKNTVSNMFNTVFECFPDLHSGSPEQEMNQACKITKLYTDVLNDKDKVAELKDLYEQSLEIISMQSKEIKKLNSKRRQGDEFDVDY